MEGEFLTLLETESRLFLIDRFCFGKNKVVKVALGRTAEDEVADEIRRIGDTLSGSKGLLFTNETEKEVLKLVKSKFFVPLSTSIQFQLLSLSSFSILTLLAE